MIVFLMRYVKDGNSLQSPSYLTPRQNATINLTRKRKLYYSKVLSKLLKRRPNCSSHSCGTSALFLAIGRRTVMMMKLWTMKMSWQKRMHLSRRF